MKCFSNSFVDLTLAKVLCLVSNNGDSQSPSDNSLNTIFLYHLAGSDGGGAEVVACGRCDGVRETRHGVGHHNHKAQNKNSSTKVSVTVTATIYTDSAFGKTQYLIKE